MLTIYIWVTLRPEIAPRVEKQSFRTKLRALSGITETLSLFVIVMGGLFLGIFTPTEAGAVGA